MKVTQLQEITGTKYSTRLKQLTLIREIADRITYRSGVHGELNISEQEDNLALTLVNPHYGRVWDTFTSLEELKEIESNIYTAFCEAENIHYRRSFEPTNITERHIGDANALFERLVGGNAPTYTNIFKQISEIKGKQREFILDLMEIHAYLNKQTLDYAYAEHKANMKYLDMLNAKHA